MAEMVEAAQQVVVKAGTERGNSSQMPAWTWEGVGGPERGSPRRRETEAMASDIAFAYALWPVMARSTSTLMREARVIFRR